MFVCLLQWCQHIRDLGRKAANMQRVIRGMLVRRHVRVLHRAAVRLQSRGRVVIARQRVRAVRDKMIAATLAEWLPDEEDVRAARELEREKRRLVWEQQVMQEKELAALLDLKRHLTTANGVRRHTPHTRLTLTLTLTLRHV